MTLLIKDADIVEIFREISEYPNYQVSSFGRIFSNSRWVQRTGRDKKEHFFFKEGKEITPKKRGHYHAVQLRKNKESKFESIHRIVAIAFILNDLNLKIVNHKDGDKHNNKADNLEWCTSTYNQQYSKSREIIFIDRNGIEHAVFGLNEFCKDQSLNRSCVHRLFTGKQKQTKGWRLKFNP